MQRSADRILTTHTGSLPRPQKLGFLQRDHLELRTRYIRGFGGILPLASAIFYLALPSPVTLLMVGAVMGALLLPVQSGATIWLQRRLDERVRPSAVTRVLLWMTFVFQVAMALALAWFLTRPQLSG